MDLIGLARAARYSYPPNSLSLCGPDKQQDLIWYSKTGISDKGTAQIMTKFTTLYPYLTLIASENHLTDPFDRRVVEAYWLGNALLNLVPAKSLIRFLSDTLDLRRKQKRIAYEMLSEKTVNGGLPFHAFHVMNVYTRTGHLPIPQTLETMDACIINYGKIIKLIDHQAVVLTRPLGKKGDTFEFQTPIKRILRAQGVKDKIFMTLNIGDWVSYHWGYICEKITNFQRQNLMKLTNQALYLANLKAYDLHE